MEIKLQKRYKYAGDIFEALTVKAGFPIDVATCFLEDIKDADVVERTHGEWVSRGEGYGWVFVCSECGFVDGYPFDDRHNYCPNCGAKMDGGKK